MRINNLLLEDLMMDKNNMSGITQRDCNEIYDNVKLIRDVKMTDAESHAYRCMQYSTQKTLRECHFLYNYYGPEFFNDFGISEELWDRILDVDNSEHLPFDDYGPDNVSYLSTFNGLIDLCELNVILKDDRVIFGNSEYTTTSKFLLLELIRMRNIVYSNCLNSPDDVIEEPENV